MLGKSLEKSYRDFRKKILTSEEKYTSMGKRKHKHRFAANAAQEIEERFGFGRLSLSGEKSPEQG